MKTAAEIKYLEEKHIMNMIRSVKSHQDGGLGYYESLELAEKIRQYMKKREHERTRIRVSE